MNSSTTTGHTVHECIFCNRPLLGEYGTDYLLIPWTDDPTDPESLNKVAKAAHPLCIVRFLTLNEEMVETWHKNKNSTT